MIEAKTKAGTIAYLTPAYDGDLYGTEVAEVTTAGRVRLDGTVRVRMYGTWEDHPYVSSNEIVRQDCLFPTKAEAYQALYDDAAKVMQVAMNRMLGIALNAGKDGIDLKYRRPSNPL